MTRIVGTADELLHLIENSFHARITVRGNHVHIVGDSIEVQTLSTIFTDLIHSAESNQELIADDVRRIIETSRSAEFAPHELRSDVILTHKGRVIRPKTSGQKRYVDAIRHNTITFATGVAGTGKTYLAMAMALAAFQAKEVDRIILTRPIVEAGESLGFLPGTLTEKVDPYIRPLYDALYDMFDAERANALIAAGTIEIVPLAFMRGRTLNNCFIILDEAQNATPEQMKMFLTRLGYGSKMVITGDMSQTDLPQGAEGLRRARRILRDVDDIAFCDFSGRDVIRHPLVADIVAAYSSTERAGGFPPETGEQRANGEEVSDGSSR